MTEMTRRKLNLDDYLLYMMLWGHVGPETGKDDQPGYEEMYMSDEEGVERKRQMDLEKLRSDLKQEGPGIIREDCGRQKRKHKKVKHDNEHLSHKQLLAKEYADKGFKEKSVEEWAKHSEVDEERANWFINHNHPQGSMSANEVPFYAGKKAPGAVDYLDIDNEDLPDDKVASSYEPLVHDSDGNPQTSFLIGHALNKLVSPGHSSSDAQ